MDRKSQVLMHAYIAPPDTQRVWIARLVRACAIFAFQVPTSFRCESSFTVAIICRWPLLMHFPTSHVMTTSNDAGPNSFRHPRAHDEVTNLSFHAHEIAGAHVKLCGMARVNPEWIRVRDLVQPLCVCAARVNLHRQTKS